MMQDSGSKIGGGTGSGYHKLEVYQLAHELGVKVHRMTLGSPRFEIYEEGSQIWRSAKSVSSNIVEGYVLRKYKNEFLHYLYQAHASAEETVDRLHYLHETQSLRDEQLYRGLLDAYHHLNSMLIRFIESVEHQHEPPMFLQEDQEPYLPNPSNLNPET